MAKPVYSTSRLGEYEWCAWAYHLRHNERERPLGNLMLVRGNGTHAARRQNLKQKVLSGEDLLLGEMYDAARDEINEAFAKESVDLKSEPLSGLGAKRAAGLIIDSTLPGVKLDREHNQKRMQPVKVEWLLEVGLPRWPFDLRMRLDSVDQANGHQAVYVTDLKTTRSRWTEQTCKDQYQPKTYSLAVRAHLPEMRLAGFRFHVVTTSDKLHRTAAYEHVVQVSEQDITAVLNRFEAMHQAILAGIYPPAHKGCWKCSPQWCEFYRKCKFVT